MEGVKVVGSSRDRSPRDVGQAREGPRQLAGDKACPPGPAAAPCPAQGAPTRGWAQRKGETLVEVLGQLIKDPQS